MGICIGGIKGDDNMESTLPWTPWLKNDVFINLSLMISGYSTILNTFNCSSHYTDKLNSGELDRVIWLVTIPTSLFFATTLGSYREKNRRGKTDFQHFEDIVTVRNIFLNHWFKSSQETCLNCDFPDLSRWNWKERFLSRTSRSVGQNGQMFHKASERKRRKKKDFRHLAEKIYHMPRTMELKQTS